VATPAGAEVLLPRHTAIELHLAERVELQE
jgi:hypothetical protein